MITAILDADHNVLATDIKVPSTNIEKMKGLIPYVKIPDSFAMVFENVRQIHMFFMKSEIDFMHLDANLRVLYVGTLKPWRVGPYLRKTKWIVEAKVGTFRHMQVGDLIYFETIKQ